MSPKSYPLRVLSTFKILQRAVIELVNRSEVAQMMLEYLLLRTVMSQHPKHWFHLSTCPGRIGVERMAWWSFPEDDTGPKSGGLEARGPKSGDWEAGVPFSLIITGDSGDP